MRSPRFAVISGSKKNGSSTMHFGCLSHVSEGGTAVPSDADFFDGTMKDLQFWRLDIDFEWTFFNLRYGRRAAGCL